MYRTLISADALAAAMARGEVRLLDCRGRLGDADFGRKAFAERHIPGAVHADLDSDLAAPPGAGGRHPLPDPQELAHKLGAWGVGDHDQVVAYDDAGGAFAARAWWCLRWLGHAAVAVLDGGIQAWPGPWSAEMPAPAPGNFTIRPPLTRTMDVAELARRVPGQPLVDARSRERFAGEQEPIDSVAGHIPGAVCLPFEENLLSDGRFKNATDLRARFEAQPADVVCYCGSGVTATHNVLAMCHAGLPEPMLYAGSWSEWIRDPDRPRAP